MFSTAGIQLGTSCPLFYAYTARATESGASSRAETTWREFHRSTHLCCRWCIVLIKLRRTAELTSFWRSRFAAATACSWTCSKAGDLWQHSRTLPKPVVPVSRFWEDPAQSPSALTLYFVVALSSRPHTVPSVTVRNQVLRNFS